MRRLQIHHITRYDYACTVNLMPHTLLLQPREGHDIHIESAQLLISPDYQLQWQRDVYDNAVAEVSFLCASDHLSIDSLIVIQHYDDQPLNFLVADYAVTYPFQYQMHEHADLAPYLSVIYPQDLFAVQAWTQQFWRPGQIVETYLLLEWINKAIATGFTYLGREAAGVQTPATTLAFGCGCCRDFATLFIDACRALGLAARFVSGYLYSPSSLGAGATHAWAEVYLPGVGWKGFDPTSGLIVGNDHISVAVSRHPEAIPPIAGAFQTVMPIAQLPNPEMLVTVQVEELFA